MSHPGFYKREDGGQLMHAPAMVEGPGYLLLADFRVEVTLPVDGWDWYESEEAARLALGVPEDSDPPSDYLEEAEA